MLQGDPNPTSKWTNSSRVGIIKSTSESGFHTPERCKGEEVLKHEGKFILPWSEQKSFSQNFGARMSNRTKMAKFIKNIKIIQREKHVIIKKGRQN